MSRLVTVTLTGHRYKPTDTSNIDLLDSYQIRNAFPVRCGQRYRVELTGRWLMSRIVIVILIYHRHKPIDSINLVARSRDVMCIL
jgi:hypothetical protein